MILKRARPRLLPLLATAEPDILHSQTDISGFAMEDIVSTGEIFNGLSIDTCMLNGIELSSAIAKKISLYDVRCQQCLLFGSNFHDGALNRVEIVGGMASGIILSECSIRDALFEATKMNLANFTRANLQRVEFVGCDLTKADFSGTHLTSVSFKDCVMSTTVFHGAVMREVDLRGSAIADIYGLTSLKGAIIDSKQLIDISSELAHQLGIRVSDTSS